MSSMTTLRAKKQIKSGSYGKKGGATYGEKGLEWGKYSNRKRVSAIHERYT